MERCRAMRYPAIERAVAARGQRDRSLVSGPETKLEDNESSAREHIPDVRDASAAAAAAARKNSLSKKLEDDESSAREHCVPDVRNAAAGAAAAGEEEEAASSPEQQHQGEGVEGEEGKGEEEEEGGRHTIYIESGGQGICGQPQIFCDRKEGQGGEGGGSRSLEREQGRREEERTDGWTDGGGRAGRSGRGEGEGEGEGGRSQPQMCRERVGDQEGKEGASAATGGEVVYLPPSPQEVEEEEEEKKDRERYISERIRERILLLRGRWGERRKRAALQCLSKKIRRQREIERTLRASFALVRTRTVSEGS
jgi:hypothetical protein